VPVAVSRPGKRITLIGCICPDGSFATPVLIIPRHTTDPDLTLFGVSDRNCHGCHQSNGFIDRKLFEWWSAEIFIPEIGQRRGKYHYHGPALLILDGCTAHNGNFFLDMCLEHNVVPVPIPPHSLNQIQLLDLCIFGVTKRLMT
jgi:hypothetical protein